jgi:hypothetical protein
MTIKRSKADNHNLCHFTYSDGRRCRMLRHLSHPGLCPFHAREEQQFLESQRIGTELAASLTGNFLNAADVNHVLGKVFTALAQNRISARNAATLAYIGQLLLQSIPSVKQETKFKYSYESWQHMITNAVDLPAPQPPIPNPFTNCQQADSNESDSAEAEPAAERPL